MSRRQGRAGLTKPREIERELRAARWRERRDADRRRPKMRLEELPPEGLRAVRMNDTARLLHRLHRATGRESFRQAAEDLAALGLDGRDMATKLDALDPPYTMEVMLAQLVSTIHSENGGTELQAIETAAELNVVPASSFGGAVQKIKRVVYGRRQR